MKFLQPPLPILHAAHTAAKRRGIPVGCLLAVAWTESRYNPKAKSKAGALGLMQIMPKTAVGLKIDPLDIDKALDGGARLLDRWGYHKDPMRAFASYVWGPGHTRKKPKPEQWPAKVLKYAQRVSERETEWALEYGRSSYGFLAALAESLGVKGVMVWTLE